MITIIRNLKLYW